MVELRMSVLHAVLTLQDQHQIHADVPVSVLSSVLNNGLSSFAGLDYEAALIVLQKLPMLLTKPLIADPVERLRDLIRQWVIEFHPAWASLIPKGRLFVRTYMPRDARQCFESAHLFEEVVNEATRLWWDHVASHFRRDEKDKLLVIGREGEHRSMELETQRMYIHGRLDLHPVWIAIDDNTLGYDIRSYTIDNGDIRPLMIEVKATRLSPVAFHLSRHEWETAIRQSDNYRFHVWYLPTGHLFEFTPEEIEPHIPKNMGNGRWESVLITCCESVRIDEQKDILAHSLRASFVPCAGTADQNEEEMS